MTSCKISEHTTFIHCVTFSEELGSEVLGEKGIWKT